MKNWGLIGAVIFGLSLLQANTTEKVKLLSFKAVVQNNQGYFAFSDGSYWKVVGFEKRWQRPGEWGTTIPNIPENYLFTPYQWNLEESIEVYLKEGNLKIFQEDAFNQEALEKCTHFLVSQPKEQVLFAIPLKLEECMVRLARDAYYTAYGEGYTRSSFWTGPKYVYVSPKLPSLNFSRDEEQDGTTTLFLTTKVLTGKACPQDTSGYYVLSDGSCWKVVGFVERWRTPSEWWNDVHFIPPNYESNPQGWDLGAEIEVHTKEYEGSFNEANAGNLKDLKQCTHVILNRQTGKILLALRLDPLDCFFQVYHDAFDIGFENGAARNGLRVLKKVKADF